MAGYPILNDTVPSRLADVEARIARLERPQSLSTFDSFGFRLIKSGGTFSPNGKTVINTYQPIDVSRTVIRGTSILFEGRSYSNGVDLEVRYYQQVPNIYTDAQITAGTNYLSLWSNSIPSNTDFSTTITITDDIRGTYGLVGMYGRSTPLSFSSVGVSKSGFQL